MAEHDDQANVDQPEPDSAIPERPLATPDHTPTDHDDRTVPLDDPERPTPPVDESDRASGA